MTKWGLVCIVCLRWRGVVGEKFCECVLDRGTHAEVTGLCLELGRPHIALIFADAGDCEAGQRDGYLCDQSFELHMSDLMRRTVTLERDWSIVLVQI